jgi:hypothetical protein
MGSSLLLARHESKNSAILQFEDSIREEEIHSPYSCHRSRQHPLSDTNVG